MAQPLVIKRSSNEQRMPGDLVTWTRRDHPAVVVEQCLLDMAEVHGKDFAASYARALAEKFDNATEVVEPEPKKKPRKEIEMKLSPIQERMYRNIRDHAPPADQPMTSGMIAERVNRARAGNYFTGSHVVWAWKAGFLERVPDTKPALFYRKEVLG